jgi:hypothetical protein
MAGVGGWWNLMYLIPVLGLVWILVTNTKADQRGVRVSGLLTRRSIGWDRLSRLELDGPRWVVAVDTSGRRTRMPMVLTRDLPRLAAASGGAFEFTEPEQSTPPADGGIDAGSARSQQPQS